LDTIGQKKELQMNFPKRGKGKKFEGEGKVRAKLTQGVHSKVVWGVTRRICEEKGG